jgi:uncharacterized protein (DUF1501 family)
VTKFGRIFAPNGIQGPDHGTGGTLTAVGGVLNRGRLRANWPGLPEATSPDRRDPMPRADMRARSARALSGLTRGTLSTLVFPGLAMGTGPGLPAQFGRRESPGRGPGLASFHGVGRFSGGAAV